MHQRIITTAKILNFSIKRKNAKIQFSTNEIPFYELIFETYKGMPIFKKGQQIQVYVSRAPGLVVIPTFFDLPFHCKKCGRFYKVYCRNCHQKREWTNMIVNRFVEENKEKIDGILCSCGKVNTNKNIYNKQQSKKLKQSGITCIRKHNGEII